MDRQVIGGHLRRLQWEAKTRLARASRGVINPSRYRDLDPDFLALLDDIRPYTMSLPESLFALREATEYIVREGIRGDVVECGVWRGGSSMLIGTVLLRRDDIRNLWMYDTYEGMAPPTEHDGRDAIERFERAIISEPIMAAASLNEVQTNMRRLGFPDSSIKYVVGRVEDTIPANAPERIALLRLDTDWYESTSHELMHLWDRLVPGGVLIIDDYGYWPGVRAAVDDFFARQGSRPLLARLDYSARLVVKPEALGGEVPNSP